MWKSSSSRLNHNRIHHGYFLAECLWKSKLCVCVITGEFCSKLFSLAFGAHLDCSFIILTFFFLTKLENLCKYILYFVVASSSLQLGSIFTSHFFFFFFLGGGGGGGGGGLNTYGASEFHSIGGKS